MTRLACLMATVLTCLTVVAAPAAAQDAPPGKVILNERSQLRAFLVFRTPVVMTADGTLRTALHPTAKEPTPLEQYQSALPPANWMAADFDDAAWDRQSAPIEMNCSSATGRSHAARHTATKNSIICARAKLGVTDPARAAGLKLTLTYVGGAVVYLNGNEIARGHMPAGDVKPDTLAERYPDDLYVQASNMYLQDVGKDAEGFARRYRTLAVDLPAGSLRKGANVLAIAVHRAPVNEGAVNAKRVPVGGMYRVPGIWAYAALRDLTVTSPDGAGVVPNVSRPGGVQVWNVAPHETISAFSYGDPGEQLNPVTIHAARNSAFSGRLGVSSDKAIAGLKVTVSDLSGPGGATLPSAAVAVRHGIPATPATSWTPPHRFDALLDGVPETVEVIEVRAPRGAPKGLTAGAVTSLWFTARPPADAAPGVYAGTITLSADGLDATTVPLKVTVHGWTMPEPESFRQRHLICPSPESVARHYGVEPWSDKHLALMARSLKLLAAVNSRQIPMNLTTNFYGSEANRQTMVRWVKAADGGYTYDFKPFDAYCDLIAKTLKKPFPIRLNCWGELGKDGKTPEAYAVSLLDPASGELTAMPQPAFGSDESYAFWQPVIEKALSKLEARGWKDVTAFGHNSYCYPVKDPIAAVAHRLWPDGRWAYTAHNGTLGMVFGNKKDGTALPVGWSNCVWTEGRLSPRGAQALLSDRPSIWCTLARTRHWDRSPVNVVRQLPEEAILRGQDGLGDFGAESFPIENPERKGRYFNLGAGRGTGGGNNASTRALLAAGPDGPTASERYEMFREGVQLSEAVIYLERALKSKAVDGELAERVDDYLARRGETFTRDWYDLGTVFVNDWSIAGQFESDAQLLALAAEVAAASK